MSWLADIAGKAEDLLNKIDQNAAVALHHVSEQNKSPRRIKSKPNASVTSETQEIVIENDDNAAVAARGVGLRNSSSFPSLALPVNSTADDSPACPETNEGDISTSRSGQKNSKNDHRNRNSRPVSSSLTRRSEDTNHRSNSPRMSSKTVKETTDEDLLEFLNAPASTDLVESSLLRSEIDSQSKEIALLLKDHRKLQSDNEALRKKYEALQKSTAEGAKKRDNSESQDISIQRSSQLEALLQEKNEEVSRLAQRLDQALEKLQSMEGLQNIKNRLEQVELENQQLSNTKEEYLKVIDSLKLQIDAADKKHQSMKDAVSSVEKEYATYKDKAKSILKTKDDVISALKNKQKNSDGEEISDSTADVQFLTEIGSLRNERELLNAEISQSRSYIETLKDETQRLEAQVAHYRSKNYELQSLLSKEKQRINSTQEDNLQLSQTISTLQLDLEREKIDKKKLQEKHDSEMNRITSSSNKSSMSSSFTEYRGNSPDLFGYKSADASEEEIDQLRTRITALSQSLLEKQSLINGLSTDKQLLQINVERLQSQLQDMNQNSVANDGMYTQSVVSNQPLYLSESPWDSRVTTRVKRAYSHVDALCCQFGLAMRQRPNLRLGFSAYVLMLHLWVFFVLFYWSHQTISQDLQPHK